MGKYIAKGVVVSDEDQRLPNPLVVLECSSALAIVEKMRSGKGGVCDMQQGMM